MGKSEGEVIYRKGVQMVSARVKRCSTWLVTGEMQEFESMITPSVGEDVRKSGLCYIM